MLRSGRFRLYLGIVLAYAAMAIFAPLIAPHGEAEIVGQAWQPSSLHQWLGTDGLGRDMLSRLDDLAPELFGSVQRRGDIVHGDKEKNLVLRALARADCHPRSFRRTGFHEGVAGERTLRGHLPIKQLGEELPSGIGVL